MIKTRLTDALGIEHPVMLAGMGGVSYHQLVAAVSEAGGFGTLGAALMTRERMIDEMRAVRALTPKPFGVDLLTAMGDHTAEIELVIRGGATVYVGGLGIPREAIALCHDHGLLVVSMCGKVKHAIDAAAAGCDVVVAQGTEAGGHTGLVATFPLVPQIVDAVGDRAIVVAAGGVFDGRHLAAALMLGADGIWVGTRFVATPEARLTPGYREAILRSNEDATVVTRAYTGKTIRVIRNAYTDYYDAHPDEVQPFPQQALRSIEANAFHGATDDWTSVDPTKEIYMAGQCIGGIDHFVPAGELVHRFVDEAERALAGAPERWSVSCAEVT